MGLPGAGKTTVAKILSDLTGAHRISSDEERIKMWQYPVFSEEEHQKLYEYLNSQTELLLKNGRSVVYDANLNRTVHRKEKYELAAKLSVQTILCWVQTPYNLAKTRRIEAVEHHHLVPSHEDPLSMFERIASVIEPPNEAEKFITLDGTKITPEYVAQCLKEYEANESH